MPEEPHVLSTPAPQAITEPEDLALVLKVVAGESASVEIFVDRMRCIPRILSIKNRRMGDALSAEDLADLSQEVFATIWKRKATFAGHSSIEAWAAQFCLYIYMNSFRSKRGRPKHIAYEQESHGASTEPVSIDSDPQAAHSAMGELEPQLARIIKMHEFKKQTFPAIARELDLPLGSVKTQYYRGIDQMRAFLRTRHGLTEIR